MAYDNNVPNIAKGFANGGSYELYLATGELQPYYCSMVNINQDNSEAAGFHSNYRSEYSLAPRVGKELKTETRVVAPNATATLLIYPWEQFYNTLPDSPGSTWQFDIMRWSGPGSSWSGTKSVHNRSTYGDLVFNLNKDQLTAIRRNILYKARRAYDKHKGSRWRGTGLYDFWQNP